MDLLTYQSKAVRTVKWLGDHELLRQFELSKATIGVHEAPIVACRWDSMHFALGMATELDELMDAHRNLDSVGVEEEVADVMWYACNEATIRQFPIVAQTDVGVFYIENLVHAISSYADLVKKASIYDKKILPNADGKKAINEKDMNDKLQKIITICYNMTASNGVYGAKVNLPQALDRNIAKLRERYPEKYSNEKAINRDTDAERKILENKSE